MLYRLEQCTAPGISMRIQRFFFFASSAPYAIAVFPMAFCPASIIVVRRDQNYVNIHAGYRLLAIVKSPAIGGFRYKEVYY